MTNKTPFNMVFQEIQGVFDKAVHSPKPCLSIFEALDHANKEIVQRQGTFTIHTEQPMDIQAAYVMDYLSNQFQIFYMDEDEKVRKTAVMIAQKLGLENKIERKMG